MSSEKGTFAVKRKKYFKILERVNVPNYDNGMEFTNSGRLDVIETMLGSTKYQRVNRKGLFHLYSKKPLSLMQGPLVLLSSHVDCEKKITQCFSEVVESKMLRGTYDNSITNAAVLSLMLEDMLAENVIVAFTGNEEVSSIGALQLAQYLQNYTNDVTVIVLDVSYEGYDQRADFTIENNFWSKNIGMVTVEIAKQSGYSWRFVPKAEAQMPEYVPEENRIYQDAAADESWDYEDFFPCFSFCLPVGEGEMHDNRGVIARQKSFLHYMEVLAEIANVLV